MLTRVTLIVGSGGESDRSAAEIVGMVVGITAVTALLIGATFFLVFVRPRRRERAILEQGTLGTAVLRAARSTASRVGAKPFVVLDLDVTGPSGPAYQTRCRALIDLVTWPPLTPGTRLAVRISPTDPMRVAVDLERTRTT